jgi:putative acetyltransferase
MQIRRAEAAEQPELLEIWLHSVRATHLFLTEADIDALAVQVDAYLSSSLETFWVLADDEGGAVGFMGQSGDEIDSLFIAPAFHRHGGGRMLVRHAEAIADGPLRVSVNEQNAGALKFYQACGFDVVGRSELDGQGRPFPLLHLRQQVDQRRP